VDLGIGLRSQTAKRIDVRITYQFMLNTSILAPVDDNHLSTPELFSGYVPLWYSVDKISFISDHDKRKDLTELYVSDTAG